MCSATAGAWSPWRKCLAGTVWILSAPAARRAVSPSTVSLNARSLAPQTTCTGAHRPADVMHHQMEPVQSERLHGGGAEAAEPGPGVVEGGRAVGEPEPWQVERDAAHATRGHKPRRLAPAGNGNNRHGAGRRNQRQPYRERSRLMTSAPPGEARAPGAADAERVGREVAYLGWRLDAPAGMPAQRVAPAGLWYALTAAFRWFPPTVDIEPPHAGQADGEFELRSPAARPRRPRRQGHRPLDRQEHRTPPAHLQLAGSPWLWRPTTLFALTIAAAAIGVALLPAAAARRHRP